MIQLLSPISLLALSGMILPLVLHLRRVRRGKTLPVGSIAFFDKSAPSRGKSLRLSDWLLLFVRLLLIAILALLLAKPVWKPVSRPRAAGWLVLEKQTLATAYTANRQLMDSLIGAGYTLHDFGPGFGVLRLMDTTIADTNSFHYSYWALAGMLQQQSPGDVPLYLLTTGRLERFRGPRPLIGERLHWRTYAASGAPADAGGARPSSGPSTVSGSAGSPAADSVLSVTLYSDHYTNDLRYLNAALEVLDNYMHRKIRITQVRAGDRLPDTQDWLFWLSAGPLPGNAKAAHVFRYESGREVQENSPISFGEMGPLVQEPLALSKIFATSGQPAPGQLTSGQLALWQDAWGKPLLTREELPNQTIDHFYSRLDPAWNDLAWSPAFPVLVLELMYGQVDGAAHDNRLIDDRQLLSDGAPAAGAAIPSGSSGATPVTDLSHLFWLIAFLLFVLERILARYGAGAQKQKQKEGTNAGK